MGASVVGRVGEILGERLRGGFRHGGGGGREGALSSESEPTLVVSEGSIKESLDRSGDVLRIFRGWKSGGRGRESAGKPEPIVRWVEVVWELWQLRWELFRRVWEGRKVLFWWRRKRDVRRRREGSIKLE